MSYELDVRSVFISDLHIGYKGSDLASVVDFLRNVRCRYLFLNGDIVDSWKLELDWNWPELGTEIFKEIVIKHLTGTKVIYLPGNHDDLFRDIPLMGREKWAKHMGLKIRNTYMHKGPNGERWLVLHGDQFDAGILRAGLSRWSDKIWVEFAKLMPIKLTVTPGGRVFSLASEIAKKAGKKALTLMIRFEKAALRRALLRNTEGVICGHTHIPIIKTIGQDLTGKPITYANSGSWTGKSKNTVLVEDHNGTMRIVTWDSVAAGKITRSETPEVVQLEAARVAHNIKRWIERTVRRLIV